MIISSIILLIFILEIYIYFFLGYNLILYIIYYICFFLFNIDSYGLFNFYRNIIILCNILRFIRNFIGKSIFNDCNII